MSIQLFDLVCDLLVDLSSYSLGCLVGPPQKYQLALVKTNELFGSKSASVLFLTYSTKHTHTTSLQVLLQISFVMFPHILTPNVFKKPRCCICAQYFHCNFGCYRHFRLVQCYRAPAASICTQIDEAISPLFGVHRVSDEKTLSKYRIYLTCWQNPYCVKFSGIQHQYQR